MDIESLIKPEMQDLVDAFDKARLAALHIDMQMKFHEEFCREDRIPTRKVFPVVKEFASELRKFGVANNWIAYTGHWDKSSYGDFKKGVLKLGRHMLARDLRFFPNMDIQDDETVFEKAQQWGFRSSNCMMEAYLKAQNQHTLIIDGVKDKHCIAGTIETGLKKGFRIYAAMDATNCPKNQFDDYAEWFLRPGDLTPEQKARVTFTTTDEILSTLKRAQQIPRQELCAFAAG